MRDKFNSLARYRSRPGYGAEFISTEQAEQKTPDFLTSESECYCSSKIDCARIAQHVDAYAASPQVSGEVCTVHGTAKETHRQWKRQFFFCSLSLKDIIVNKRYPEGHFHQESRSLPSLHYKMGTNVPIGSALVVGGCGNLGRRIVDGLLQLQPPPQVSVLDVSVNHNKNSNALYYAGNITSRSDVMSVLEKARPKVIFHTASPPHSLDDLDLYMRVNVDGTRNLLECAQDIGCVQAFVYTSSASVIHDAAGDLVEGDETMPLVFLPQQKEIYSHSKAMADKIVLAANLKCGKMLTVSLRPSGIFGEMDTSNVKAFVEAAAAGKYKAQVGSGKNLFDFTYVENLVHAEFLAAHALLRQSSANFPEVSNDMRVDGEAFLVTNDEHMPFWDYARAIGGAAGYPTDKSKVWSIPIWLGLTVATFTEWWVWLTSFGRRKPAMSRTAIKYSVMTRTFRVEKIKKRLGYRPQVSMEEGIRRAGGSFRKDNKTA